jgi:hypothetical protein
MMSYVIRPRRAAVVAAALSLASACASAPPDKIGVAVFEAPLEGSPMPAGCRLLFSQPPVDMNELQMTGSKDPFHAQRQRAAAAGGNVLLVRSVLIVPRQDYNCPAASPITDCPPSEGYWATVVFEGYTCSRATVDALRSSKPK